MGQPSPTPPPQVYFTPVEVAQMFDCCTKTIYTYVRRGTMEVSRLGGTGKFRFYPEQLRKFLHENGVPHSELARVESIIARREQGTAS